MQKSNAKCRPCVDGIYRKASKEYVGYCWYKKHKGFLTLSLMKKQECLSKGCHYFQKFEDSPYWQKKAEKKQLKRDRKVEERAREARAAFILEVARSWTEQYGFMDFISAREPSPGSLVLTYFSDKYINLGRCRNYMGRVWNCYVELKSVQPDRELISRLLNQKKERNRK